MNIQVSLMKYAIDYLSKFISSKKNLNRILKNKIMRMKIEKKDKFLLYNSIPQIIIKLENNRLIDDKNYALSKIRSFAHQGKSKLFIKNYLIQKGIEKLMNVKTEINDEDSILAPLSQGEMSIHDVRTIHASEPNISNNRRIGMVLRYCATDVKQTKIDQDKAILVKGEDHHQNFGMIPRPISDMDDKAQALAQSHGQIRTKALMDLD